MDTGQIFGVEQELYRTFLSPRRRFEVGFGIGNPAGFCWSRKSFSISAVLLWRLPKFCRCGLEISNIRVDFSESDLFSGNEPRFSYPWADIFYFWWHFSKSYVIIPIKGRSGHFFLSSAKFFENVFFLKNEKIDYREFSRKTDRCQ